MGGIPIPLVYDINSINTMVEKLDGFVITGGAFDINPSYFSEKKNISLATALANARGLNQSTSKGKDVYILRSKDLEGKPRIFKADISSPTGYLVASEFNLQTNDIVFYYHQYPILESTNHLKQLFDPLVL